MKRITALKHAADQLRLEQNTEQSHTQAHTNPQETSKSFFVGSTSFMKSQNAFFSPRMNTSSFELPSFKTKASFVIPRRNVRSQTPAAFLKPQQTKLFDSQCDMPQLDTTKINQSIQALISHKPAKTPEQARKFCAQGELNLHQKTNKQWFKTRAAKNTHSHYYNTSAEVKSNKIVDDMFQKLDEDGGGTLDCAEITALFKANGINMTIEQVANMFGEALRMDAYSSYRKSIQAGLYSRAQTTAFKKKSLNFNMKREINPSEWKQITKSAAALKTFKHDLKAFRDQMTSSRQTAFIPVTMDELMARFVTNIERRECKDRFKAEKRILTSQYDELNDEVIMESVRKSLCALKDLLSHNTIQQERQPNSENSLYLKLMERAQETNDINLIKIVSSKLYDMVYSPNPDHLQYNF